MGRIIPCIRENKKCSKPPTSYPFGSAGQPVSSPWSGSSRHAVHFGIHSGIIPCVETSNQLVYILWWWSILYIYILLVALASFCVRGHSYPGSICRILGTIYRIPETIYRIPAAIYCIILILAFFCFQTPGPIFKKETHSEAKAVTKPSVYNNSTLMGFGPVF